MTTVLGRFVLWLLFVALGFYNPTTGALSADHFRVVGLFEPEEKAQKLSFTNAIEKLNLNVVGSSHMVVYYVEEVLPNDSFEANKGDEEETRKTLDYKVCRQMKEGIAAVFGPISKIPRAHVQSICQAFDIPHLSAQWDPRETRDYYSINVYPDNDVLGRASAELVRYWNWKHFTVIYEDDDSLLRLQEVLKATKGSDHRISIRKLDPFQGSYISMFKDLKEKGEYHIVVDCSAAKVQPLLHEALKVNMLSEYYHFHFTTLDLGGVDLEDYKYSGANVTAMRLIDPTRTQVVDVMTEWRFNDDNALTSPLLGGNYLQTEVALMYDAVHLFFKSLSELTVAVKDIKTQSLSCNKRDAWDIGNSLLNYMKSMDFEGLSGRVRFSPDGRRTDIKLDIVQLSQSGLKAVGDWHPTTGVNISTSYQEKSKEDINKLKNMTLRVVTVYEEPYLMMKQNPDGTVTHEGFMIDLLNLIKGRLPFNYTVYQVADKNYGRDQGNGEWDGMVGDLMKRDSKERADLAAAGMTITYEREKVLDFTKPFLNLGITIVYKKPTKAPPELFSFLSPLSIDVWIYMLAAYLCVSFMLFVIARFSPYEWTNPHPCNEDSDYVENQFTILNSLWFTIGSLMQQGSDIAPRSASGRILASSWYLFTLIMVSTYTANLAAFLTIEEFVSPFNNVEELAEQNKVTYGIVPSGSTRGFFQNSDVPTYKRMWAFMETNPDVGLVSNSKEGINRVKTSDYAFITESSTIDYQVQRNCELTQVGGLLDSKGYGLAFPKDSPWTDLISREIIYFQETQQIQKLYDKWWKEKSGGKCDVDEGKKDASSLGVKHVGGVFVVLVGGLVAGLLLACLEFMWKAKKNAKVDKQSFCSEMSEELRFAVRCCGKPEKTTRRVGSKDIVDNGIQFAPLTGMTHRNNSKELYA
ncbi:glutamate receptor ionotropic, kainate 2-like isoform X2 [Mya arenaria]|uniref:glutamate receptor ionotropic, kainate 2-like isoform X2 n=1 Tax=Mya arenaria TaxID=6604 RepID=UPI0022DEAEB3|nr:glutamate receptor ionotropic, kainate 2-like isoform X2 [Mya arenaria]